MTPRTARQPGVACALARQLTAAIEAADPHLLHVVPSTTGTLHAAAGWIGARQWRVIGLPDEFAPGWPHASALLSPAQYLAQCRDPGAAGAGRPTVVFTDQCVSAEHAPLLVHDAGEQLFFPATEMLAAKQYGITLSCWDGSPAGLRVPGGTASGTRVLQALRAYDRACGALGEAWLMRPRRPQRTVAGRVAAARHRLRRYQSIAMLASLDEASAGMRLPLLEGLASLQQKLARVAVP